MEYEEIQSTLGRGALYLAKQGYGTNIQSEIIGQIENSMKQRHREAVRKSILSLIKDEGIGTEAAERYINTLMNSVNWEELDTYITQSERDKLKKEIRTGFNHQADNIYETHRNVANKAIRNADISLRDSTVNWGLIHPQEL